MKTPVRFQAQLEFDGQRASPGSLSLLALGGPRSQAPEMFDLTHCCDLKGTLPTPRWKTQCPASLNVPWSRSSHLAHVPGCEASTVARTLGCTGWCFHGGYGLHPGSLGSARRHNVLTALWPKERTMIWGQQDK